MMIHTITGESGARWVVDERQPAALARRATPFIGWKEGDESHRVWVQRVRGGNDELFGEDREHLRSAWKAAQHDGIKACPFICQILDIAEPFDLYLFQELGDLPLDEALRDGPLPAEERRDLQTNLSAALNAIHDAGLVHCDVQPSNVLRVHGIWKLIDLGAATPVGEEALGCPKERRFVPPSFDDDRTARPNNDWWGLTEVLRDAGATNDELQPLLSLALAAGGSQD